MSDQSTCHYCGADYAEGRREAAEALAHHLRSECPAVPERIRQSYDRGCAFGNCDL